MSRQIGYIQGMVNSQHNPADTVNPFLGPEAGEVYECINAGGSTPLLLVCDHASNAVPPRMGHLGLAEDMFERHIAHDIGAAALTRLLAERLDATALLSGYSRLVMDLNRQPGDPMSIPEISDGVVIPGNTGLTEAEQQARTDAFHTPYHQAITDTLAHLWRTGKPPALFSIHSFTPSMGGEDRFWHIGVLWNRDARIATPLIEHLSAHKELHVGDNEPYSGREVAYTIDLHAGAGGLPHCAVEIRQDLIEDDAGVAHWADLLEEAFRAMLNAENLHRVEHF